ncbi:MAG: PAS domain S-box protein, partial [SAR324 cluster bacterium]|nr:PAS domain S-box protein [SAR324 cluster bacterium]
MDWNYKRSGDGRLEGFVSVLTDITELRRVEAELTQGEERFRNLVEGSIQGIIIHHEWKPLFVNGVFVELVGRDSVEEIMRMPTILDFFPRPHRETHKKRLEALLRGDSVPSHLEFQVLKKDGSIIWVDAKNRVVDWKGKKAVQATVVEITDRKSAEEELQKKEKFLHTASLELENWQIIGRELQRKQKLLRTVVVNSPVILWAIDREGKITFSEGKGLQRQGKKSGELVGTSIFEEYKDFPDFLENVKKGLNGEKFSAISAVSGVVYEGWFEPLKDKKGKPAGLVGVSVDITERKLAEEKLRSNEALLQAIFDAIPTHVFVKDRNSRILKANKTFQENFGVKGENIPTMELPYATPAEKKEFIES